MSASMLPAHLSTALYIVVMVSKGNHDMYEAKRATECPAYAQLLTAISDVLST